MKWTTLLYYLPLLSLVAAEEQCYWLFERSNITNQCYRFYETPETWAEAEEICKSEGARFAAGNRKKVSDWGYHAVVFKHISQGQSDVVYMQRWINLSQHRVGNSKKTEYIAKETLRRFVCAQTEGSEADKTVSKKQQKAEQKHLWEVLRKLSEEDAKKQETFAADLNKTVMAVAEDVLHQLKGEPVTRNSSSCSNDTAHFPEVGMPGVGRCFKIFENKEKKTVREVDAVCRAEDGYLRGVYAKNNGTRLYGMSQYSFIHQKEDAWRLLKEKEDSHKGALDQELPDNFRFICLWGYETIFDRKFEEIIEHASLYIAFHVAEELAPEYDEADLEIYDAPKHFKQFFFPWESPAWWVWLGVK